MVAMLSNGPLRLLQYISQELCIPCAHIDTNQSFAQLGGHSLSAIRLSHTCRRAGIQLSVSHILKARSLSTLIKNASKSELRQPTRRETPTKQVRYQLTEMQWSLLRGSQIQPGVNVITYHHYCPARLLEQIKSAWQTVLQSEPIFQTRFVLSSGHAYMVETNDTKFCWNEMHVKSRTEVDAHINGISHLDSIDHYFKIIRLQDDCFDDKQCCVIWHVHHALIDGYSMKLLLEKLTKVMKGESITRGPSFAKVSQQLRAYQEAHQLSAVDYWQSKSSKLQMASNRLKIPQVESQHISRATTIRQVCITNLQAHAKSLGITTATLFIAAWSLVLSKYCDSDVVSFGVVASGRSLQSTSSCDVVGPLINTLPVCISVEADFKVEDFLRAVFENLAELSEYEWSLPSHGYNRGFDTAVAMQFDRELQDNLLNQACHEQTRLMSDITLTAMVHPSGNLSFLYDTGRVLPALVDDLADMYCEVLQCFSTRHTVASCSQQVMSVKMQSRLFSLGNCISGLTTATSAKEDLISLFSATARKHPHEYAVEKDRFRLTYCELQQRISTVASVLKGRMKTGEIVAVHADQSINWIIATYAVLSAGGVYCPLNANLSQELRNTTFESSTSKMFLTPYQIDGTYTPASAILHLSIEQIMGNNSPASYDPLDEAEQRVSSPAAEAYLCFTSGSTGKPKGVLCTHQGLVAFQSDFEVRLHARCGERIAQIMSPSFDGSIHEIFSALSYGATLVLPDSEDLFAHLHRVDTSILTPSIASLLHPQDYRNLARIYLVGEPVPQPVNDVWAEAMPTYNMYGPTEATCGATIKRLQPNCAVTVGRPNPTTRIYVLDRNLQLAPPGVIGAIFLAGIQVSNGYLNRKDATAHSFLPDSVCFGLNEKMYRTGDLGYWDESGELVCLGRNDRQVKLRGFRLELDDIEARINTIKEVSMSAVTVMEDYLVAMIQPEGIDLPKLSNHFRTILPAHAIPRRILCVNCFPRTSAGKIDYAAIRSAAEPFPENHKHKEETETESKIIMALKDLRSVVSGVCEPSVFSTLHQVDSIQQLKLASHLSSVFEIKISIRDVIAAANILDLAATIDIMLQQKVQVSNSDHKSRPASWISYVEEYWARRHHTFETTSALNVSFGCLLGSSIDRVRLIDAFSEVLRRHDILRSRFLTDSDSNTSRSLADTPPTVQVVDSLDLSFFVNKNIDIHHQDVVRVAITNDSLIFVASHIVCDLTTLQILLDDAASIYNGLPAPRRPQDYINCDAWQVEATEAELEYWSQSFSGLRSHVKSPNPAYSLQPHLNGQGCSVVTMVPSETGHKIHEMVQKSDFTHHHFGLAAVALALTIRLPERLRLVLGSPHFNRKSASDLTTVGLFLEPIPVVLNLGTADGAPYPSNAKDLMTAVQKSSHASLAHAIPWNQLLAHLSSNGICKDDQLFDTMVTFHDKTHIPRLPLGDTQPLYLFTQGAKFHIMFEFTQLLDDNFLLRIEYNDLAFSKAEIMRLEAAICIALQGITNLDKSFAEIKQELAMAYETDAAASDDRDISEKIFGARLDDLSVID